MSYCGASRLVRLFDRLKSPADRNRFKISASFVLALQFNEAEVPTAIHFPSTPILQNPADVTLLLPATSSCESNGENTSTASTLLCSTMRYFNFTMLPSSLSENWTP